MHPCRNRAAFNSRLFRMAMLVVFSFCALTEIFAQGTYPKIEASFNIGNLTTDPFDYAVTDVRVQIVQPDNSTVSLPAFFDGGTTWRVRHTPTMAGVYSISNVTMNGSPLSVSNLQPTSWTVTGFPISPGFVRVDPTDSRRLITSDGRRYFPVGENMAWSSPSANATNIFPKMGAAHGNWSRVWMTHFYAGNGLGLNLDWPKVNNTFGQLSLMVATNWDAIVAAADKAGIHFQMTLQHHGQYSSTNGSNANPNWEQNPYNFANGGFLYYATNFFTDSTARSLTERKLRYIVARWGYSPSIMAFELFNEVEYTDAGGAGQWVNIEAWHNEMAQFIRTNDIYHHLITTSDALTEPIWDQTDYYQHHEYPADLITGLRDARDITASQPVAPDFAGECGIDFTPHVGISPPIWAGVMSAQSGAAMPWYWDTIDPNNDYFLIQAAADFVTRSGLEDEDALSKSSPQVSGGAIGPLIFSPGGGWATNEGPDTFVVGDAAPEGIGSAPSYLQGFYHHDMTPNGYTFLVNYPQNGTFSVQVTQIARSGAGLEIFLDGILRTNISFPSAGSDTDTNSTATISVSAGSHSINITNNGLDWVLLGNFTLNPYVGGLGAYAIGTNNWQALWLWHRTNVFLATPGPAITGTVQIAGLDPGTYAGTWWDTFGAGAVSNFTFTVSSTNPVTLGTPPVLRSLAFYAGLPAQAGVIPPNLTQTAATNSPPFNLPLIVTNSGGLPLAYSLSFTSSIPSWLSFSSTNGYVSKASALTVSLAFKPAGLAPGTYTFTLFVNTGDPLLPVTVLPISFTVTPGVPSAPQLRALSGSASQFVYQLQGDTDVAYLVQVSSNLTTWLSVATNTLLTGTLNVTNPIPLGAWQEFWRALWQP